MGSCELVVNSTFLSGSRNVHVTLPLDMSSDGFSLVCLSIHHLCQPMQTMISWPDDGNNISAKNALDFVFSQEDSARWRVIQIKAMQVMVGDYVAHTFFCYSVMKNLLESQHCDDNKEFPDAVLGWLKFRRQIFMTPSWSLTMINGDYVEK